jgi:hypothetical protein
MYFEDQCFVNDYWFGYSGKGLWGTKEPEIDEKHVNVRPVHAVLATEVARCSNTVNVTQTMNSTCNDLFSAGFHVDAIFNEKNPTNKAVQAALNGVLPGEEQNALNALKEVYTRDLTRCMAVRAFENVTKAFNAKSTSGVKDALALVTADKFTDPKCGEPQTYTDDGRGNKKRNPVGYDANVCGLSAINCPLIFSIDSSTNSFITSTPKLYTVESARCGEDFFIFRLFVLSRAQSSFMVTVVWGQVGNILIRKTQIGSIFSKFEKKMHVRDDELSTPEHEVRKSAKLEVWRMFDNHAMLWSILQEVCTIILLIWAPRFNAIFLLEQINVSEGVLVAGVHCALGGRFFLTK